MAALGALHDEAPHMAEPSVRMEVCSVARLEPARKLHARLCQHNGRLGVVESTHDARRQLRVAVAVKSPLASCAARG